MKKLLVMVIALAVVFGMSSGVMAEFGLDDEQTIDVTVSVSEYAEFTPNDEMKLTLNFNPETDDDYDSEKTDSISFDYKVNTPTTIDAESTGFGNLEELDNHIEYQFASNNSFDTILTFFAPGTTEEVYSSEANPVREGTLHFRAIYNKGGSESVEWQNVLAGDFTDTITFTVSAQ